MSRWTFGLVVALAAAPAAELAATPLFQDGFEPLLAFAAYTPMLDVAAGSTGTFCYHFRSPASAVAVRSVTISLGSGVAHAIVYSTHANDGSSLERRAPGALANGCSLDEGPGTAGWIHAAHAPVSTLLVPDSDGGGTPLAIALEAQQALVLQVRVVNASDAPLSTDAAVLFELLPEEQAFVPTATYRGTQVSVSLAPGSSGSAEGSCTVPVGVQFWRFTTRTHQLGTGSWIEDGATLLVEGSDWMQPPVLQASTAPFVSFGSGAMTYGCSWFNSTGGSVNPGGNEDTDEACMGVGYFFPASRPLLCVGDVGPL